ncbi:ATP-binding protein [Haloimpatiens sp. FM7315]|uniref:tRNA lysidine(34) synthetase n=1 Tax=Haloimpatiens sp. FM7315 TaxID=3298609 RepID=UPI0035A33CE9
MLINFKKEYNKLFLNDVRKSIEEFNLIESKDKIAVGLSGGKDSVFLLLCLKLIKQTFLKDFEFIGINIDLGYNMDMNLLQNFCNENNIEFISEKTNIGKVVFEDRHEKNPCSLCSTLRRGALARVAKAKKCNKIALGHNSDDVIETLFLNALKVGKLGSFHPNSYNEEKKMHIIRPLVYLREALIERLVDNYNLPVIKNNCPVDKKTSREEMKKLLISLEKIYPDAQKKIITSLKNVNIKGLW